MGTLKKPTSQTYLRGRTAVHSSKAHGQVKVAASAGTLKKRASSVAHKSERGPEGASAVRPHPAVENAERSVHVEPLLRAVRRHVDLTPEAAQRLRAEFESVLEDVEGLAAVVPSDAANDTVLTTQEAADMLSVSRPYLAARIDAGDIALFQMVGNQRRVLTSEVMAWRERERNARLAAMRALAVSVDDEYGSSDDATAR